VRGLCELRTGCLHGKHPGDRQCGQPQLSWSVRSRPGLARESAHGRGERDRRVAGVVRRTAATDGQLAHL